MLWCVRYALLRLHPAMSQVQACSALQMAESAARKTHPGFLAVYTGREGDYTWDSLDQALTEGRRDVCGSIDARDIDGRTALHFAANFGRTSTVRALVAAGASLNIRDDEGWTPLQKACSYWPVFPIPELVAVLVAAGADIHVSNPVPTNNSPLSLAARAGCLRTIRLLLNAGASARTSSGVWGPLHGAVWGQTAETRCDCVVALLRAGADINAADHYGRSPLHLAINNQNDERLDDHPSRLVTTLLRKGARLQAPDELPNVNDWPGIPFCPGSRCTRAIAYVNAVRQAGGIVRYEKMRRAPFITALTRCFPLPSDTIPLVVEFWVRRALEY